ncbi:hemerythrin domain-containing protein [Lutimonas sp.]|uniref:hemerythrin domain-containing protein n=1 Tax=Lutimonas sp. TaxID=1872403 RepID=UPI003D9BCBF4
MNRNKRQSETINPLDAIRKNHKFHLYLCDAIEDVADGLPAKIDKDWCRRILDILPIELSLHHKDEELGLFPLLQKRSIAEDCMPSIINELEREHLVDTDRASELLIPLSDLSSGQSPKQSNVIGCLFHGFVEAYRRHLIREIDFLLPLAHKRLIPGDLDFLKLQMIKHRNRSLAI